MELIDLNFKPANYGQAFRLLQLINLFGIIKLLFVKQNFKFG